MQVVKSYKGGDKRDALKKLLFALLIFSCCFCLYAGPTTSEQRFKYKKKNILKSGQKSYIDRSLHLTVNFTTLAEAISSANALLNSSIEGSGEGEYPAGSKSDLQNAIAAATAFVGTDTAGARIDFEISKLYDACSTFESLVNTEPVNIVDKHANKQTRYLYLNLKNQMDRYLLFGMHHATGYGVGWTNDDDRSDIKDVCGDFPAIYGEEMRNIVGGIEVERIRYRITSAYKRGGIVTMCWHQLDPDNRHFYASEINNEKIVAQILPGCTRHLDYLANLKIVSEFFKSLRGENGEAIPVIFRPYHEHLGTWFWWGVGHCTTDEYNQLWQFTVNYLHTVLNVHNLLWAISPNLEYVDDEGEYFDRFPGDDYVDIYGVDFYNNGPVPPELVKDYSRDLHTVVQQALINDKIPAITEIGQEGLDDINWHTRMMINPIKHDSINNSISYAVTWRNANTTHFHAPYPGHPSVPDFIDFYNDTYTMFESDLPDMYSLPAEDVSAPIFTKYPEGQFVSSTKSVEIKVETDERALLRWNYHDEAYDAMPYSFTIGQRQYAHRTFVEAEQGSKNLIYVQAMDVYGNKTDQSIPVSFTVDTLQAMIPWYEQYYQVAGWNHDTASFGSGSDVTTKIQDVQTAYFVKDFELSEKPTGARILIQLNGGFAVYINGFEITRYKLPEEMVLCYDTPPLSSTKTAKAVDLLPEMVARLKTGVNKIAIEIHGGSAGVQFFDALIQTTIGMPFYYCCDWYYYDLGNMPRASTLGEILSIERINKLVPEKIKLYQNYPNPFNSSTKIRFDIHDGGLVTLTIYNITGRKVQTLANGYRKPGGYEIVYSPSVHLTSGIYTCVLKTNSGVYSRKMIFLK